MIKKNDKNFLEKTDQELVSLYQKSHDTQYFGLLFNRYLHFTYGVCLKYLKNREDSKDAVMQIFEQLQVDLKTKQIANFQPWLYVVAKNYCLMQLRKTKHIIDIDVISIDQTAFMESQEDLHLNNEIGINHTDIKLKDCLEQLSLQQRKCIELFYLKTHCYSEIVKLTQYDLKKVKSYIQNGKRNLKNCMEK